MVITMDMIFIQKLTSRVSKASTTSSPISISSITASICEISADASMAVSPDNAPAAEFTTDCPRSKTAIVIVKVLLTRYTAIIILKKYLKNIHVSMSCMLFFSVSMEINS